MHGTLKTYSKNPESLLSTYLTKDHLPDIGGCVLIEKAFTVTEKSRSFARGKINGSEISHRIEKEQKRCNSKGFNVTSKGVPAELLAINAAFNCIFPERGNITASVLYSK
jgi:hypothetical protein